MPEFQGIFAPLTTPFEGDRISSEKFGDNIRKYNATELTGYVILGSSGESVFLTDGESEELVKTAKKTASPDKKLIAGTARESTQLTLEFTNRMAGCGMDAALIRCPSYFKSKMDTQALRAHFLTIADRSEIPVIVYNIPRNTGVTMTVEFLAELAHHENIAGFKDSTGTLSALEELLPALPAGFSYLLGAAGLLFPGIQLGASGGIVTVADIAPEHCVKLYDLIQQEKWSEARRLQIDFIPLNKAVIQTYGVPAAKYALDLLGYYGGPCRLPLLPLDEKGKKEMEGILKELELL